MKPLLFTSFLIALTTVIIAQQATTVSTFECISVYWSPDNGSAEKNVLVRFRISGTNEWHEGLPIRYDPIEGTDLDKADYRGSIVNLKTDTEYEIELSLEGTAEITTITASTWTDNFPVAKIIKPGNLSSQYNVNESGTPNGYILIDGTGSTIDVDGNINSPACINITGNYIIIRGYKLTGGLKAAIMLGACHDIVIENCDMSNWGELSNTGFGKNYQGAITSWEESLERIIIQRNLIHNPRYDANNWSEAGSQGSNHPEGQQAISFYNSAGNHVFRYNEVWSDKDHYFNDIFGMLQNDSYYGFPGPDTDIYGNYLSNCWDDALELDGGNRNVRVWGNYSENIYMHISNTGTAIGPLYIWGNVYGKSYSPPGSTYGEYSSFMKMGEPVFNMGGCIYVFNNTLININNDGSGGIGTNDSDYGRYVFNTISRNNIIHVRNGKRSISDRTEKSNNDYVNNNKHYENDYDYDFLSGNYPLGNEQHGITGKPIYQSGYGFDYKHMTASFYLESGSPGIDAGKPVPNFREEYTGSAPDMGAFESSQNPIEYGVHAYLSEPFDSYTLKVKIEGLGKITPGDGAYTTDSTLLLTATPALNYKFDHWNGDLTGTINPQAITMNANKNIKATFIYSPVYDTIHTVVSGGGIIKLTPSGSIQLRGTKVEAFAIPGPRRYFVKWDGDISESINPVDFILDSSITINAGFNERTGPVFLQPDNEPEIISIEAENHQDKKKAGSYEWIINDSPFTGASGDKYIYASPDFFYTILDNIESTSPHVDFDIEFNKAEKYYVWIRGYAEKASDNSIYLGLDYTYNPDNATIRFEENNGWNWSNKNINNAISTLVVSNTGIHTLNIWMRDDGAAVDKIVLTTDPDYIPSEMGPKESEQRPGLGLNDNMKDVNPFNLSVFPNPVKANSGIRINYNIKKKGNIELLVYNVNGQIINTLFSGNKEKGEHVYHWKNTGSLNSGIYFLYLKSTNQSSIKKIVIL